MWTKINKRDNVTGNIGRGPRTTYAVRRNKKAQPFFIIPKDARPGQRADIFSDGNGKLAYVFSSQGDYKVMQPRKGGAYYSVTIPTQYSHLIPEGTTDVSVYTESGMTVLDLSQISRD